MERQEFDSLEIEANGLTPPHVFQEKKAAITARFIAEEIADALRDAEPGHNYGTYFNRNHPINTTR